jgi:hypothetical protein
MRLPGKSAATTGISLGRTVARADHDCRAGRTVRRPTTARGGRMKATAITMMGQRKPGEQERRRAMVRLNGMMFYSVAVASFFESAVPLDTSRLLKLAAPHPDVREWLETTWLPRRAAHGRLLRDYIQAMWPEFEWDAARQEFRDAYVLRSAAYVGPPGLALEILARCVTETSLAVFYRTLAKIADDPALAALARAAAEDHGAFFAHFRGLYQRFSASRRAGLAAALRAMVGSCRAAREVDLALAFQPLAHHWHGGWVFPELTYAEFLQRLARMLRSHAALGPVQRLLFRPWLNPPRKLAEMSPRPAKTASAGKIGPAGKAAGPATGLRPA